jgi:hypothetical protein
MILRSIDKLAGILSMLWAVGGYAFLRWGVAAHPQTFGAMQRFMPLPLLGWFGVSLLLVIAGLRRGNLLGRFCALCTIGVFLYSAEPLLGTGRRIGNMFRKDEYAFVYYGAPECRVTTSIHTDRDVATFTEVLRQFAKQQGIRECRQKQYMVYSGPGRPTHKGEHVAIWSGVSWTTNASEKTGGVRLAPYDKSYPQEDFKRLADSLASTMRAAFPGRVEVKYKEAGNP